MGIGFETPRAAQAKPLEPEGQAHPGAVGPAAGQEGMEVDQMLFLRV